MTRMGCGGEATDAGIKHPSPWKDNAPNANAGESDVVKKIKLFTIDSIQN